MKYTTETYIIRAREVHGDKYDYRNVVYVSAQNYIEIGCPEHGFFRQKAAGHLLYGCKACGIKVNADKRRVSKDAFIARARKKHGEKYDYNRVDFRQQHEMVEIGCSKHGYFRQPANDHLKGHGCSRCGSETAARTKQSHSSYDWKARAIDRHENTYDYSCSEFAGWDKKITITCRKHGPFCQLPNNHLRGNGCPDCKQEASRMGFDEFVRRSHEVHGEKYDYVSYSHEENSAGIICAIHGYFSQRRFDHLHGAGCPSCAVDTTRNLLRYTREEICDQITKRWGDRIVIASNYSDKQTKTTFFCLVHGDFKTTPDVLLSSKHGCPQCAILERSQKSRITQDEFEKRANVVHDRKYRYGTYDRSDLKMEIFCPEHGKFLQTPSNHLTGYGCPICGTRKTASQHKWLDMMGVRDREVWIEAGDRRYRVDGYDPGTRTVYEFWGDFWHGNPKVFAAEEINGVNGLSFGQLYEATLNKRRQIANAGYKLVEIWERDWKRILGNGKAGTKAV